MRLGSCGFENRCGTPSAPRSNAGVPAGTLHAGVHLGVHGGTAHAGVHFSMGNDMEKRENMKMLFVSMGNDMKKKNC